MAREIIKRVILSEKGSRLAALNQYFLEVDRAASKPAIRQAVEAQFGVHGYTTARAHCSHIDTNISYHADRNISTDIFHKTENLSKFSSAPICS